MGKQSPNRSRRLKYLTARRAFFEMLEGRQLLAVSSIQAFDDVAPVIASFQAATVTNDNRLSIAIDTPHPFALADITIYRNDGALLAVQQLENVPTDAAGVARITTPVLANGDYLIRARAGLYAKYFFICDPGLAEFEAEGSLTFRVDTTRPVPTVSSPVRGPTNSVDPLPFVVRFSEPVKGFQASDAVVANGTIQEMTVNSPSSFTFFVRPTAPGDVSLGIPAGVAVDAAGNPNTASNRLAIAFDPTAPALVSVTRQPVSNGITNADSLVFRTTFSEPVTKVDASDFAAIGTTAVFTGAVQISPRIFDLTLSGGDLAGLNGPVKLAVRSGNDISDVAGTGLTAQTPAIDERYFLDNTAPTVRIAAAVAGTSKDSFVPVTIRFSEPVTGFFLSDIVLANATASGFAGSGATYTFNLAPQADGRVTVQVPAGVASDTAGNGNVAAPPFSFISDRTPPTVRLSTSAASPTNAGLIPVAVTFSESVRGFTVGDVAVTNGTVSGFTGSGASYRFNAAPAADGRVTISVGAAVAQDTAGNNNLASNSLSLTSDSTAPGVIVTSPSANPTNSPAIPFRVTFQQAVAGFTATDPVITNGTITGFTGSGDTYRFQVAPTSDGLVTVRVPAAVAQDLAGNDNLASGIVSILSDRTPPSAVLSTSINSPTNDASIPIRLQFSEAVSGLTLSDIVVSNGTASNLTGSGSSYRFNVSPLADGSVTIRLPKDVARDAARNGNTAATPLSILSDRTRPGARIVSTLASPTNAAEIPFQITFTEPVTGFTAGDIGVFNGQINGFSGSGSTYTVLVTPTAEFVSVGILAGVAQDAAGNRNTSANSSVIRSDRDPPTTSITTNSASPTNADLIPFRIQFSEAVTGFFGSEIDITNGTLSSIAGSGATYDILVSPTADGLVTVKVAGAVAKDAAGNGNLAATPVSVRSDRTAPTVDVSSSLISPTNADVIPFKIVISEPVTGFAQGDIQLVNGGIMDFTPNADGSFTVNVVPNGDGQVQLRVPAGSARDSAGNDNTVGSFAVTSDRTSPRATLTYNPPPADSLVLGTVTIEFTEPVTGLDINDLKLTFAGEVQLPLIGSMLSGSGATYTLDLSKLTKQPGNYELTLTAAGSDIFDRAGNPFVLDATTTWTHAFGNP